MKKQRQFIPRIAIYLGGLGVSMMVNMDIVANPPDNLAKAISDVSGKSLGLVKNIMDTISVGLSVVVDVVFGAGLFSSVGTVVSMLFIGGAVAVSDYFFKENMPRLAGLAKRG